MIKQLKKLTVLSLLFTLTACGSSETAQADTNEEQPAQETADTESAAPEKEETAINEAVAFEEFTPVDNENCTITVKDVQISKDCSIKLLFENKSAETEYSFDLMDVSVNGLSIDSSAYGFYLDLPAGKKSNEMLTLASDKLVKYGFDQSFTDIEIHLTARDYNFYETGYAVDETFHIYPYGEDKAETFERKSSDTDIVLVDNEILKCVVIGVTKPADGGSYPSYTVDYYIENKNNSPLSLFSNEIYVNGYKINGTYLSADLGVGKSGFASQWIDKLELAENDIENIEEIELDLSAWNPDTYEEIYSGTYTINP